ncbi:MAG: hypothetical protein V1772_01970, partial [Chloroflexota bacterium]
MSCTSTRRHCLQGLGLTCSGAILAACQPKVVEKVVEKVVTQVVVKEVTRVVASTPQVIKETVMVEKQVTAGQPARAPVVLTFHHID